MSLAPSFSASCRVERTSRTTSLDSSADALQRQVLDRALGLAAGGGFARAARRARAASPRGSRGRRPGRRGAPGATRTARAMRSAAHACSSRGERVVEREQQAAVGVRAAATQPLLRALGERQQVERRRRAGAGPPCAAARKRKRGREARGELVGLAAPRRSSSTSTTRRPRRRRRARRAMSVASMIASLIAGSRPARRSACTSAPRWRRSPGRSPPSAAARTGA